jgi:uncharacterized membrane protein YGL010W
MWQAALVIHVVAWILQFIGHGVFEGRAPALLDSLDQVPDVICLKFWDRVLSIISKIKICPETFRPN